MGIQLSISLLVSDRAETLKKCLDSLKGLLQSLPCELIAVFTGEKEETLEMVKQYTDCIIPFKWCNDFSAARNVGLKAAKGEWFMFIDDDEWFESTQEISFFFQSGEYQNYRSAAYVTRNYMDWNGNDYTDAYAARLIKMSSDVRFVGIVHEYLTTDGELRPLKYLQDYVHHYGYVSSKKRGNGRAERNIPLLLKEIKKNPLNGKNYMQLSQEYLNERDLKNAEKYARKGLVVYAKEDTVYNPEIWLMSKLPIMIYIQGDKKKALSTAEKMLENKRCREMVQLHQYKTIVQISSELQEDEKCIEFVKKFENIMKYLEEHTEICDIQNSGEISFQAVKAQAYAVYVSGLVSALRLKDYTNMQEIMEMIPWDNENDITDSYYDEINKWKENEQEEMEEILKCFSQIDSENAYVMLQKMLYAETNGIQKDAQEFYLKCCKSRNQYIQKALVEAAFRNEFDIAPVLNNISLECWNGIIAAIIKDIDVNESEENIEKSKRVLSDFPLYESVMEQQISVKRMLQKVLEGEELVVELEKFCQITKDFYCSLYQTEFFDKESRFCLPSICKFALNMQEVLSEIEEKEYQVAIKKLGKALESSPQLRVIIKRMLDYVVGKTKEIPGGKNEEFAVLGQQIKQVVSEMIAKKQYKEVEPVLKQLSTLLPDDLEVLKMKQIVLREGN